MKTVSDFKKALQVGTQVHTIFHCEAKRDETGNVVRDPDGLPVYTDKDLGTAPITIVQTTQFAIERIWKDGTKKDSWCKYPKASECEVKENSITIFEDNDRRGRVKVLTYSIVKEDTAAAAERTKYASMTTEEQRTYTNSDR